MVGQQDRLERGGDTWMTPVSYDKIGVRYRRWRNTVAAGEVFGDARGAAQMATAGQVFAVDTAAEAVLEGVAEGFADQVGEVAFFKCGGWMAKREWGWMAKWEYRSGRRQGLLCCLWDQVVFITWSVWGGSCWVHYAVQWWRPCLHACAKAIYQSRVKPS